jgi:hypothetical protein
MVGSTVTVALMSRRVRGTVEEVTGGGRRLTVLTEEGELIEFGLSQATGYFTGGATQSGPRLSFDDE